MTTADFRTLGVPDDLVDALAGRGITSPFPIQELTLPLALARHDLIGQARTGSGKTLAFGLPLLAHLDPTTEHTDALVVAPTRELALQVVDELRSLAEQRGVRVVAVYGGVDLAAQSAELRRGAHVVVGTPGRLLDQLRRGHLDLSHVRTLVLDEADEMLDMGFLPDVERIIAHCPPERHTMLFSATMPAEVVELARRYMRGPTFVRAEDEELTLPSELDHHFFLVHRLDKPRIVARLLQQPGRGAVLVFTRTKAMADRAVRELAELGVDALAIHGDLRQATRERNLARFRGNGPDVLVATEVASRGLDIDGVTHVINYDCPDDETAYVHRVGRTARAGGGGTAITLVTHAEVERAGVIKRALGLEDLPIDEVFSTSELLTERFGLPAETPWDHLGAERRARARTRPVTETAAGARTSGAPAAAAPADDGTAGPPTTGAAEGSTTDDPAPTAEPADESTTDPAPTAEPAEETAADPSADAGQADGARADHGGAADDARSGEPAKVRVRRRRRTRERPPTPERSTEPEAEVPTSEPARRRRDRRQPEAAPSARPRARLNRPLRTDVLP